ncbi:MAG: tetratricopeptide repeat protein [Alphaproteobacteria bacterium]
MKILIRIIILLLFTPSLINAQTKDPKENPIELEKQITFLPAVKKVGDKIRIELYSKEEDLTLDFYKNYKIVSDDQEVSISFPRKVFIDVDYIRNNLPNELVAIDLINRDTLVMIFKKPYNFYHYISTNSLGLDISEKTLRPILDVAKKAKSEQKPELVKTKDEDEFKISAEEDFVSTSTLKFDNLRVKSDKILKPIISSSPEGFSINFPISENVGTAIYERGDKIFFLLDKLIKLETQDLSKDPNLKSIKPYYSNDNILMEITPNEEYLKSIKHDYIEVKERKTEGETWVLDFFYRNNTATNISNKFIKITTNKNLEITPEMVKKRPQISVKYKGGDIFPNQKSYIIEDKEFEDELIIVPTFNDIPSGVPLYRKFINFDILPSLQGLAIRKKGDTLFVSVNKKRVNITENEKVNLVIKSKDDELKALQAELEKKKRALKKAFLPTNFAKSIFPFKIHFEKSDDDSTNKLDDLGFMDALGILYQNLYQAPEKEREKVKANIIRYMFYRGAYDFSLATIDARKQDEINDFDLNLEMQLIKAASYFMLGRYEEASGEFEKLLKQVDNDELKFWLWASKYNQERLNLSSRRSDINSDLFLVKLKSFFDDYPKDLMESFGLSLAEYEIYKSNPIKAIKILDALENISDEHRNMKQYLFATALLKKSQMGSKTQKEEEDEALRTWKKLSKEEDDRLIRYLSNLAIIRFKIAEGAMKYDEAIDALEKNQILWRGDTNEIEGIRLLAEVYFANKQYSKGFRTLALVKESFPDTEEALIINGEIQRKLTELFAPNGKIFELPNIKILGLYFDTYNLMPIGEAGDKIIQRLIDKFIESDLFNESVALLQHQINFRTDNLNRGELIFKLTKLYLENKMPEKALETLDQLQPTNLNEKLKEEERLLRARAYIDLKRSFDFIRVLSNDYRTEADLLRIDLLWKNNNWNNYSNVLESLIKKLGKDAEKLDLDKNILYLAFAYYHLNEPANLENLIKDKNKFITNPETRKKIEIISQTSPAINSKNLDDSIPIGYFEKVMYDNIYSPNRNWKKIAKFLKTNAENLIESRRKDLRKQQEMDIISYLIALNEITLRTEMKQKLEDVFKKTNLEITPNNFSAFEILDTKASEKINDKKFTGKYPITKLMEFIDFYKSSSSISALTNLLDNNTKPIK